MNTVVSANSHADQVSFSFQQRVEEASSDLKCHGFIPSGGLTNKTTDSKYC